jgi:general secretion pathway protein J
MNARAGLTLVELLVALAVFALIAVAGTGLVSGSIRTQEVLDARESRLGDLQHMRALLTADLGQIAARPVRDEAGFPALTTFEGGYEGPTIAFLELTRHGFENPQGAAARGSLQHVRYFLRDGVLIRVTRSRLDPTGETRQVETTLIDGIEAMELGFIFDGTNAPQWSTRGAGRVTLPQAVEITLEFEDLGRIRQLFLTPAGRA